MKDFQNCCCKLETEGCPKTEQEKVVTLTHNLGDACPSWCADKIKKMTLHQACRAIKNLYMSKNLYIAKPKRKLKEVSLKLKEVPMKLHNVPTESENTQVNNLRRI